jgi:hypothetical protein
VANRQPALLAPRQAHVGGRRGGPHSQAPRAARQPVPRAARARMSARERRGLPQTLRRSAALRSTRSSVPFLPPSSGSACSIHPPGRSPTVRSGSSQVHRAGASGTQWAPSARAPAMPAGTPRSEQLLDPSWTRAKPRCAAAILPYPTHLRRLAAASRRTTLGRSSPWRASRCARYFDLQRAARGAATGRSGSRIRARRQRVSLARGARRAAHTRPKLANQNRQYQT